MSGPVITLADYFMGRDRAEPAGFAKQLTPEIRANAVTTIARANLLLARFRAAVDDAEARGVTSGWRPPAVNQATPGAAKRSLHMTGQAIDIADPDGALDHWCLTNPDALAELELWQEHPSATKNWCHVQTIGPRSGLRCFYP